MKWVTLEFSNLVAIESQVEEVIKTHEALADQLGKRKGNLSQISRAQDVLRQMMQQRVLAMEKFYQENDLDPRSQKIENCRIKLKRVLKGLDVQMNSAAGPAGKSTAPMTGSPAEKGGASGSAVVGKAGSKGSPSAKASPPRGASRRTSVSGGDPLANTTGGNSDVGDAPGGTITLKIQMTHSEFEVLRMRREAMRALAKIGGASDTSQAWENAFFAHQNRANQGLDAHSQGINTFHDVPYQGDAFKEQALMRNTSFSKGGSGGGQAFRTMMKPDQNPDPGFISAGPYTSANSDVVSRTMRYTSNSDAMRGGPGALDKKNSFKSIVPRTRVTTTGHKAESIGGLGY